MTAMVAACIYCLLWGALGGIWLAERRHEAEIRNWGIMREAIRKVLDQARFVGSGNRISNIAQWRVGDAEVRIIVEKDGTDSPDDSLIPRAQLRG